MTLCVGYRPPSGLADRVLRTLGSRTLDDTEVQALYSRAISPFFDLQAGARYDFGNMPGQGWAVVGVEGWHLISSSLAHTHPCDRSADRRYATDHWHPVVDLTGRTERRIVDNIPRTYRSLVP